jgi:hypothetical protein
MFLLILASILFVHLESGIVRLDGAEHSEEMIYWLASLGFIRLVDRAFSLGLQVLP